ncbi:MAG: flippase-like domain-containing protein [Opitutales bacterium]|nr:flippase-like domain-containing protein [Opitutales bacterium]MCH8539160.1 flippase-like domain-containing protein [Opitutales bacterium]
MKLSRHWVWGIKFGITAGVLAYLFRDLDWALLREEFAGLSMGYYALGVVITLVGLGISAMRWRLLLGVQELSLSIKRAFTLTFIGIFFNAFFLGSTGGDISKWYYIAREHPEHKTRAILSVIMDRAVGLMSLLGLGLLVLPWQARVLWENDETRIFAVLLMVLFLVALGAIFLLLSFPFHRLPQNWHQQWVKIPGHQIAQTLLSGFRAHGQNGRLTLLAFALSLLLQFLLILGGWALAQALSIVITLPQVMLILVIVQIAASLPISIGGHGVREAAMVMLFGAFSIVSSDSPTAVTESAIAFSLLFFSLQLWGSLLGGLLYLTRPDQKKYRPNSSA